MCWLGRTASWLTARRQLVCSFASGITVELNGIISRVLRLFASDCRV